MRGLLACASVPGAYKNQKKALDALGFGLQAVFLYCIVYVCMRDVCVCVCVCVCLCGVCVCAYVVCVCGVCICGMCMCLCGVVYVAYVYVGCVCVCMHYIVHVDVRGPIAGVGSLLTLCGFQ